MQTAQRRGFDKKTPPILEKILVGGEDDRSSFERLQRGAREGHIESW